MREPCEICGARVTNMNQRTTTCSDLCTRAKRNGITRVGQIKRDMKQEQRDERLGFWQGAGQRPMYT
jgi:hypothetical protein